MTHSTFLPVLTLTCVLGLASSPEVQQHQSASPYSRIRFDNARIAEVVRFATRKSTAFEDVIATLEQLNRVVYIEEGHCRDSHVSGCLQLMATPGGGNLVIRIDPRQAITTVAVQLAHELYHASEIAREPRAVDEASARELFSRIGFRTCDKPSDDCWETRAAMTFERLVREELNGAGSKPHHSSRP